jgi:O-antigen ligase
MFPRLRIAPETTAWMTPPFVAATLLMGPVLGSVVSAALGLAALLGVFQYLNDNYKITQSRPQRLIFAVILTWFLTEALFGLAHYGGASTWIEIIGNVPFLGFIIFVSGMELSDKTEIRRVIHAASPAAAFGTLAVAAAQIQFGLQRAEGLAGNAGPFAALCLILFACCLLTAAETAGRSRLLGIAGAVAAAVCVVLSGMRGLWPCLLVLPAALAVLYRDVLRLVPRRAALAAALMLLAVLVVTQGSIERRIQTLGADIETLRSGRSEATSLSEHLLIWQAGWSLMREAPLAGHGLGQNRQLIAARTRQIGKVEIGFTHFHNAILNQGVQTGIVGIAALLAMFFTPLMLALRHSSRDTGRHGLAIITVTTIIYAFSGATGIMFGHDLMDAVWIAAISYGSFMAFGQGLPQAGEQGACDGDRGAASGSLTP